MALAQACMALWIDYKRSLAAWLEGLHLALLPDDAASLAARRSRLLHLLHTASLQQRLQQRGRQWQWQLQAAGQGQEPAGAPDLLPFEIGHLYLFQHAEVTASQLLEVADLLSPRLCSLNVVLKSQSNLAGQPAGEAGAHQGGVHLGGHFPHLTALTAWMGSDLLGASPRPCLLDVTAPRLQTLTLRRGVLARLPPALTSLDFHDVRLEQPAATATLAGKRGALGGASGFP